MVMESLRRFKARLLPGKSGAGDGTGAGSPDVVDDVPGAPYAIRPARAWAQLGIRAGLWGAIAVGFFGGLIGLLRSPAANAVEEEAPDDALVPSTVAGFAELAVEEWLTVSNEDDDTRLDSLFLEPPMFPEDPEGARTVERVLAVGGAPISDGYWKVTVAVDLTETVVPENADGADEAGGPDAEDAANEDAEDVRSRWFVEVGIAGVERGGLVAVDAPALVPERVIDMGELSIVNGMLSEPDMDDPLVQKVQAFFDAYLAGRGHLSDHLAEAVREADPVTPAPFVEVVLTGVAVSELDDGSVQVRVAVDGITAGGVVQGQGYELQLVPNGERWEVFQVTGAPMLEGEVSGSHTRAGATPEPAGDAPGGADKDDDAATTAGDDESSGAGDQDGGSAEEPDGRSGGGVDAQGDRGWDPESAPDHDVPDPTIASEPGM